MTTNDLGEMKEEKEKKEENEPRPPLRHPFPQSRFNAERLPWMDAHRRCNMVQEYGPNGQIYKADLVTIESQMEDKFVYNWLYKTGASQNKVWTGLIERTQNM